jgi:hypothetical protein
MTTMDFSYAKDCSCRAFPFNESKSLEYHVVGASGKVGVRLRLDGFMQKAKKSPEKMSAALRIIQKN